MAITANRSGVCVALQQRHDIPVVTSAGALVDGLNTLSSVAVAKCGVFCYCSSNPNVIGSSLTTSAKPFSVARG